jgi:hypothetical protein
MHNKSAKRLLKLLGNCKLIFLADGLRVSVRQRAHATAEGSVRMQRLKAACACNGWWAQGMTYKTGIPIVRVHDCCRRRGSPEQDRTLIFVALK